MKYLVEIDHPRTGAPLTAEGAREFIRKFILPTIDRATQLMREHRIVAGGPVAGRVALRFIVEAASPAELDQLVTSLRLWAIADTRVTPLIDLAERRTHVEALLEGLPVA